jgi:hypothetical protein
LVFRPALARLLIAHAPGPRQDGTEDHLFEPNVAIDLAGDVADHPAQIGPEFLERPVGAPELLGVGVPLMLDQRELADPRIGLAKLDAVFPGQAAEKLDLWGLASRCEYDS